MKRMIITMRCLMELVYSCCLLTERKTKQSKTDASYKLIELGHYIVTSKIITSSYSLITSKIKFL